MITIQADQNALTHWSVGGIHEYLAKDSPNITAPSSTQGQPDLFACLPTSSKQKFQDILNRGPSNRQWSSQIMVVSTKMA